MKPRRVLLLSALALAGVALPSAFASDARADEPPRIHVETIVPDVTGLLETDAVRGLEAVYELDVVEVPSTFARDGRVVAQHPRAGARLAFRGLLRLEIGRAVTHVSLPSVTGLDLAAAERALLDRGLVPVPVFHRVPASNPFGTAPRRGFGRRAVGVRWTSSVLRQDPQPGARVPADTKVRLEVRLPYGTPHRVRVPSLYGLTGAEAAQALRALGLVPTIRRTPSAFEQETVIEQRPVTGAQLPAGQRVDLVVAIPAGRTHVPARTAVPDFRGASRAEAYALARRAGLRLEIREAHPARRGPGRDAGRGPRQLPTAGVRVPLGTVVRLVLPARRAIAGPPAAVPPRR